VSVCGSAWHGMTQVEAGQALARGRGSPGNLWMNWRWGANLSGCVGRRPTGLVCVLHRSHKALWALGLTHERPSGLGPRKHAPPSGCARVVRGATDRCAEREMG